MVSLYRPWGQVTFLCWHQMEISDQKFEDYVEGLVFSCTGEGDQFDLGEIVGYSVEGRRGYMSVTNAWFSL